jgi:multiple RNA-binding domain-containing protein 1
MLFKCLNDFKYCAEDPKLREFLAVMQPRNKAAIWDNDDNAIANTQLTVPVINAHSSGGLDVENEEDALYEDLPADGKHGDGSEDEKDIAPAMDPLVVDAAVSDLDYLKARVRKNFEEDEEMDAMEEDEKLLTPSENVPSQAAVEAEEDDEDHDRVISDKINDGDEEMTEPVPSDPQDIIAQTGRLFVRNLPYSATEDDLKTVFEKYGEVREAHIVLDKTTKKSKGYALVQFMEPDGALQAAEALDGEIFMGRLLHILPGHQAPTVVSSNEQDTRAKGESKSSYKREKEAELKASAGDKSAWNSLFMRSDTVAEAVAAHFGVSKSELLDAQASDMAVRLALGETQVIAQTKAGLADAGVNISALEASAVAGRSSSGVPRSSTVLLVKNLPYSTDKDELEQLLATAGPVSRLVLPMTKTLALVEYMEPQDARRAFQMLAYKKYHSVPLYLEWAHAKIFDAPKVVDKNLAKSKLEDGKGAVEQKPIVALQAELIAEPADVATESQTLFIKNLSFQTDESKLRGHFLSAVQRAGGTIRSVKIAKKKSKNGTLQSAGFGFIECSTNAVAQQVAKELQGSTLQGHKLVIQMARDVVPPTDDHRQHSQKNQKAQISALVPPDKHASKIVVRNVAFEATRKDIYGLFAPFGAIKTCRLPRKFDGNHRGFAFVEFATPKEAQSAMEAALGTHLYGRRLVTEWAEEDTTGLDELRAKTAAKYRGPEENQAEPAATVEGNELMPTKRKRKKTSH